MKKNITDYENELKEQLKELEDFWPKHYENDYGRYFERKVPSK